jgi:cytochrome b561
MQIRNTAVAYGSVALALHWLVAILLIVSVVLGWIMPDRPAAGATSRLVWFHTSIGLAILGLIILRLLWRAVDPPPLPVPAAKLMQRAARLAHAGLYVLVIAAAATGWIAASGRGWNTSLFGIVTLPSLVAASRPAARLTGAIHQYFVYILLGAAALHVAAGVWHHWILRDATLARMLPIRRRDRGRSPAPRAATPARTAPQWRDGNGDLTAK